MALRELGEVVEVTGKGDTSVTGEFLGARFSFGDDRHDGQGDFVGLVYWAGEESELFGFA